MATIPDVIDWYQEATPYAALGIESPDADAKEVRDAYNGLKRDLQEQNIPAPERAKRSQELESAYEQIRMPAARVKVDFFLLDRNLGRKQCEAIAAGLPKPNTDVEGVFKPRNIRVTHEVLYEQLQQFFAEPPKVGGVFPTPIDLDEPDLPLLLAVRFDS